MNNVLIVDDEAVILKILGTILRKIDKVDITEAQNGREALEKINDKRFSLIITDLNMPELGGIELIKELRGSLKMNVPVFVMSGAKDIMIKDAVAAGASHIFKKPVNREELTSQVKTLLNIA